MSSSGGFKNTHSKTSEFVYANICIKQIQRAHFHFYDKLFRLNFQRFSFQCYHITMNTDKSQKKCELHIVF